MKLIEEFAYNLKVRMASPKTIETYTRTAQRMTDWIAHEYKADFESDTVDGMMISHWAGSISELKPSSRKLYHTAATSFLDFLYNAGAIKAELSKSIPDIGSLEVLYKKQPEARPNKTAYTVEQVKQMLETKSRSKECTLRNHALIAVLVSTGLRIFEALQLNVGDVYGDDDVKVARKGSFGNKVGIVIPDEVKEYTDPYIQWRERNGETVTDDSPLFTANGERLTDRTARASVAELEKKLGLPTGLHTFRHTALTETGKFADAATARDLAGQKNISVTNRYLHSSEDDRKHAASKLANTFFGKAEEPAQELTMADLNRKIEEQQKMIEQLLSMLNNK